MNAPTKNTSDQSISNWPALSPLALGKLHHDWHDNPARRLSIHKLLKRYIKVNGHYWSQAQLARELKLSSSVIHYRVHRLQKEGAPITLKILADGLRWRTRSRRKSRTGLPSSVTVPRPLSKPPPMPRTATHPDEPTLPC